MTQKKSKSPKKPKIPPTTKFILEVTELQGELLVKALDLFSRIGMGQIGEVQSMLALEPHVAPPHEHTYQAVKNALDFVKRELLGLESGAALGIHHPNLPDKFRVAWDLQQVIRHKLAWTANPAGGFGVNYHDPAQSGKEPLATMSESGEYNVLIDALRQSLEGDV